MATDGPRVQVLLWVLLTIYPFQQWQCIFDWSFAWDSSIHSTGILTPCRYLPTVSGHHLSLTVLPPLLLPLLHSLTLPHNQSCWGSHSNYISSTPATPVSATLLHSPTLLHNQSCWCSPATSVTPAHTFSHNLKLLIVMVGSSPPSCNRSWICMQPIPHQPHQLQRKWWLLTVSQSRCI